MILLVLLTVIPALGLFLYTAHERRQVAAVEAQEGLLELAQDVADDYRLLIENSRELLLVLARLPAVLEHDLAACRALMSELMKTHPQYIALGTLKPNGDVFCRHPPPTEPVNVADFPWVQRALMARDFTIGNYQIGRVTKQPVLPFAYPAIDRAGKVQAVVYAIVHIDWIKRMVSRARLPREATFTLFDINRVILGQHPGRDEWVGKPVTDPVLIEALKERSEGVAAGRDSDGSPRFIVFTTLKRSEGEVVLAISVPQKIVFAEPDRILNRNLFWLAIVSLIALAAAWFGCDLFILRQLNSLVSAAKKVGSGDLSARAGLPLGDGELARLAHTFDEMAEALQRRQIEARQAEEALRELSGRLLQVQDEERRRIARELHDNTSPLLTALIAKLYSARYRTRDLDATTFRVLDESLKLAEDTSSVLRTVSYLLHPPLLDKSGLLASLRWYLNDFANQTGVRVEMDFPGELTRLSRDAEIALFRVVQECLANILRHSGSPLAKVRLALDQKWLTLEVGDEGRGMPPSVLESLRTGKGQLGVGLSGMRERMRQLRGRLEVSSSASGTLVTAILPLGKVSTAPVREWSS